MRRSNSVSLFVLITTSTILSVIACSNSGSDKPVVTTTTVGASGGTVSGSAGASLTIPPGALSSNVEITMTEHAGSAPSQYSPVTKLVTFAPDGLIFSLPVTVTMALPDNVSIAHVFWSTPGATGFDDIGGDLSGRAMQAQITHFSEGFLGAGCPCATNTPSPAPSASVTPAPAPAGGTLSPTAKAFTAVTDACTVPSPSGSATPTPAGSATPVGTPTGATSPAPAP